MKRCALALLAAVTALGMVACSDQPSAGGSPTAEGTPPVKSAPIKGQQQSAQGANKVGGMSADSVQPTGKGDNVTGSKLNGR